MYDVEALRRHFPSLAGGTAYFDGPGGTQTPDVVGEAMRRAITQPLSNRGRLTLAERNADDTVLAARTALADLVGGVPEGVRLGTVRLAGRWYTRRRSPDGLIATADFGASRIPSFDADIERLLKIGRYAKPVIA